MTSKILSGVAAGSVIATALLMSGTAFADTSKLNQGVSVGVQAGIAGDRGENEGIKASINASVSGKVDADNDNDGSGNNKDGAKHATSTKPMLIKGNGQPVIGGTVSAVSGNTLTVVTASGVTYTVNAASSTIAKGNATTTVSGVTVGDKVLVQGTINGSSVVATSVIDSTKLASANGTATTTPQGKAHGWFFGGLGGFFHSMFGFF